MFFEPRAGGLVGQKHATLQVSTSNVYEGAPGAALSGESTPPDILSLSPTSHDFGTVAAGSTSTTTFTVTNTGQQTSAAIHTALEGADAAEFTIGNLTDLCTGVTLGVGASCTFDVTFAPAAADPKSATVTVWTVKSAYPTATLTGNTGAPGCTVGANTGCVTLNDVVVRKRDSAWLPPTYGTPQYTLSGSISFSPTCQAGVGGCDYSSYQDFFSGSGTFSLDDGSVVSGTWTATFYSAQFGPSYQDAGFNGTDCASVAIRTLMASCPSRTEPAVGRRTTSRSGPTRARADRIRTWCL